MTKQNKKEQATVNEQATVQTVAPATTDELVNKTLELTTEEFNSLCNRLSMTQLEQLTIAFKERAKAELNKAEKEVLAKFKIEENEKSIAAASLLLSAEDATVESVNSLPVVFFNQLFNAAVASLAPATVETGKAKHNDLSHAVKLLVARFSYQKEANCDNFIKRDVQPLEPLTLADFSRHCEKNTFANNTSFPVTIDGVKYDDKAAAVKAMSELMFNWYQSAITGNGAQADKAGA